MLPLYQFTASYFFDYSPNGTTRDLGLLKRDQALQKRYDAWAEGVKSEYGSMGK